MPCPLILVFPFTYTQAQFISKLKCRSFLGFYCKSFLYLKNRTLYMPIFDTGEALIPFPSLPGTFKGKIKLNRPVYVTEVKTISMKGAKGNVKSYKFIDPLTGVATNDLIEGHNYNIEIRLDSYPKYFHNTRKISNDYGTIELDSFIDANGRGRIWIPVLQIDGEPAIDKWVPLTSAGSAVCMIGMPTCAETGNELRNTEVWVDNTYIHKYAPEDIYFCDGCLCDGDTDCGFGEHLIVLVKKGYDRFEQVILVEDGDLIDLDPILVRTTGTKEQIEEAPALSSERQRAVVRITLYE